MLKVYIIECENAKAWSPVNGGMFKTCLPEDGENDRIELQIYNVVNENKVPDDILSYDAIIITGSRFNCRDRDTLPWFEPLCDVVRAAAEEGKPKVYAGCFGCQLVAHALGGRVDYNPMKNFVLKAETIRIVEDSFIKYLSPVPKPTLTLIVSHGDCVHELPPNSELLANSDSCCHEMFIAGAKKNILACQSHPEFDLQYCIYDRIWPAVVEKNHRLTSIEEEEAKATFEAYHDDDSQLMRKLISNFLLPMP